MATTGCAPFWHSRGHRGVQRQAMRGGFCRPREHKTRARTVTHLLSHLWKIEKILGFPEEDERRCPKKMSNGSERGGNGRRKLMTGEGIGRREEICGFEAPPAEAKKRQCWVPRQVAPPW
jgi:hypothetical protein